MAGLNLISISWQTIRQYIPPNASLEEKHAPNIRMTAEIAIPNYNYGAEPPVPAEIRATLTMDVRQPPAVHLSEQGQWLRETLLAALNAQPD